MEQQGEDRDLNGEIKLLAGNANPKLAKEIADHLGLHLCNATVSRFSDGEIEVHIKETVRGADLFIIQPTCPPVNENLMELLILIDAVRRASARAIIAVIPYYGYGRQDRKDRGRAPITARLVANLLETAGVNRILTMDLHAGQIQGFFNVPVDNLRADPLFVRYFYEHFNSSKDTVIVAPDLGATIRARMLAEQIDVPLAVIEKRRGIEPELSVLNIIGDVEGKRAIIFDDIVSSGSTLVQAANTLLDRGASDVYAFCTHGVFSGQAIERVNESALKKVVVTNTIFHKQAYHEKIIDYISVGEHLAKTIERVFVNKSVSHLFPHY
ncbi:ribose-phosphate pyrophosphokinase [Candidatus Acetothermia bacterium]|jgi:ribose-phosphate pyrophosphokinase|nr:ribose-phosphate pyrophosphokinase [Candidatus Acetothermia bacterium]MCI2427045.1 ribose-phosphate pyrophosphokinase [Candidatus Acetothermia bacterium]MCI2428173.1 ribose-phosphate pyrophosphokinase [Candidatus Acetothermia bacterium]